MTFIELHKKHYSKVQPYLTIEYTILSNQDLNKIILDHNQDLIREKNNIRYNSYFSFFRKYSIRSYIKQVPLKIRSLELYNKQVKFNDITCVVLDKQKYCYLGKQCLKLEIISLVDFKKYITLDIFLYPFKMHLLFKNKYIKQHIDISLNLVLSSKNVIN